MTAREKKLAGIVLLAMGILALWGVTMKLIVEPGRELDKQQQRLTSELAELEIDLNRVEPLLRTVARVRARSFDSDPSRTSELTRAHLVTLIQQAGLSIDTASMRPFTGRTVPNVLQEVGWQVSTVGPKPRLINLLYLLREDPHLGRIDDLRLSPDDDGDMELRFRYVTLVIADPKYHALPPVEPLEEAPLTLNNPQRDQLEMIVARDVFRPYVPRPQQVVQAPRPQPKPTPQPQTPAPQPQPQPAQAAPAGNWRVVGLPRWADGSEVMLRNEQTSQVLRLHTGDEIEGGEIVMVDYRTLPRIDDPTLRSSSRVIIKLGRDLWAIELGQTTQQRYRLPTQRIPEALQADEPRSDDQLSQAPTPSAP
jgi:hypothetical protein